jgi:S-adenosylmethionine uptake transporter
MDAMIKHIGSAHGPLMIAFARFGFGTIVTGALFFATRAPAIPMAGLKLHALRALTIVIAAPLFFYGIATLPLTEVMTIGFSAPLIVPFMAAVFLKEKLRLLPIIAAVIGFIGVVIAAWRPSDAPPSPEHTQGVIAVLISVVAYAGGLILLRHRAGTDGAFAIGLMGNLMPAVLLAIPALALEPLPPVSVLPWFALIGTLGAIFWLMLTWSYARAAPQVLAPLEYTGLLWGSWRRVCWSAGTSGAPPRRQRSRCSNSAQRTTSDVYRAVIHGR